MEKTNGFTRKAGLRWPRQVVLSVLLTFAATSGFAAGPYDIGQTVAFISDHDPNGFRAWKKWIENDWPEVDRIIHPKDLGQFIHQITEIGQQRQIQRLYFFGHANSTNVFLTGETPYFNANTVRGIRRHLPLFPQHFTTNAEVVFFNCYIGQNTPFLQAVADSFLGINGGTVRANKGYIDFRGYQGRGGQIIERMVADQSKWVVMRIEQKSTVTQECENRQSRGYYSDYCRWARGLGNAVREQQERNRGQSLIRKIE